MAVKLLTALQDESKVWNNKYRVKKYQFFNTLQESSIISVDAAVANSHSYTVKLTQCVGFINNYTFSWKYKKSCH